MNIGRIIHKIRKEKKMTLFELSEASGVAVATLSRMENGKMTGTLDSHMRICKALQVALPDIYRDLVDSSRQVETRSKKPVHNILAHDKRYSVEMLVTNPSGKKMLPAIIKIAKGGSTQPEETKIGMEKFIYIIDGKIEAAIGREKFNLTKNDTLYFESSATHCFKNMGNSEALLISVASGSGQ
ncbi:MAG: helix-turn-helix transcriptional regulator [Candidatus Omnitrophica bacterium]|nr:helix-turn-helix transcriptional regulator [Candidatus Omnitrophota bacterium]